MGVASGVGLCDHVANVLLAVVRGFSAMRH
jgi:hypothetical protein